MINKLLNLLTFAYQSYTLQPMNNKRYTSSFPLQTEFVMNADESGDHVFTQLKRDGNVCLYRRTKALDGRKMGFEVFVTKTVKAGAPLPGGGFVEKDYESYPGKSAFGKTAWFCCLDYAEERFDKVVKSKVVVAEGPGIEESNDIPEGEFSQVEFATMNCLPLALGRIVLKGLVDKGLVKENRREQRGPGRATCLFIKA